VQEKTRILKKINNECFGGSENQLRLLLKHLPDESFKDINLILNNTSEDLIEKNRINILWMQHFVNQDEAKNMGKKDYLDKLDYIIFNSNWNFEKYQYQFKIPENKSLVIKNAIEEINYQEKPKDEINLVYHTTPWRGLVHLLKVFKKLNNENVKLNICSSTIIYGKKFDDILGKKYQKIFEECKTTKNVNYFGFVKNEKVIDLLKKMHIYSFPSIWPETSCISAIEAMAAGCQIVSTNLGALYETCSPFGTLMSFDPDLNNLEKKYEKILLESINNFWSEDNQKKLKLQRETINLLYSWKTRSIEWKNFFDKARIKKA
tara:strand:- start:1400 stop:2356 length:957 start_codon:yes stop_codon:yes gene_type:complete